MSEDLVVTTVHICADAMAAITSGRTRTLITPHAQNRNACSVSLKCFEIGMCLIIEEIQLIKTFNFSLGCSRGYPPICLLHIVAHTRPKVKAASRVVRLDGKYP